MIVMCYELIYEDLAYVVLMPHEPFIAVLLSILVVFDIKLLLNSLFYA